MLARKNPIVFLGSALDGCCLWRLWMPYLGLPGSSFWCFRQRIDFSRIVGNEICVVQRCCTKDQFEVIKTISGLGLKIIYDLDDDVWDLPSYNPAHAILQQYKAGFAECIRLVDVVTVSTRFLERVIRKNVKNLVNATTGLPIPIVVCENRIYEDAFVKAEKPERLTVGWAGSSSHIGDLDIINPVVAKIGAEHSEIDIEYRGCQINYPPLDRLPNYRHKLWSPVPEYGARMPVWRWSIALAPVTDHPFNSSKSCIKLIEAAYCGIPCLASWVRPYESFCMHDPELQWLLCAGPSNWDKKLRELIHSPEMRIYYAGRMRKVMEDHYSFRRRHEGWDEAFRLARGGLPEGSTVYDAKDVLPQEALALKQRLEGF